MPVVVFINKESNMASEKSRCENTSIDGGWDNGEIFVFLVVKYDQYLDQDKAGTKYIAGCGQQGMYLYGTCDLFRSHSVDARVKIDG